MASLVLVCGVALGALGGCVVGPHYKSPDVSLAPIHHAESVAARNPAEPAPALESWWSGFHDPVLSRVVERALAQNFDLAAAIARVDQARAMARGAGAGLLPQGEFGAQSASLRQSLDSPIGTLGQHLPGYYRDQTLRDVAVGASWEPDLFGGLRRRAEAAGARAQATEDEGEGIRLSVAAQTADAYLQIRGDQARLEFANSQIKTDTRLLELVRLRFTSGVATDREVAQAEALLARARESLPPLRTELDAQMNRLDVLMGAQPGSDAGDLGEAGIPPPPAIGSSNDTAALMRRRPDVNAAERKLAAANAEIGASMAEYYPQVSLSGLLGFESLQAGTLFSAAAFQPAAVAGLHWRLFDFGRVDAQVAQANAATAEALARYRQTLLRASEDIENAFMALVQLELQSHDLSAEVDALNRARAAAEAQYLGGAIDLTDVLEVDRQLLVAQDEMARTQADASRAAVSSFEALGGGW